jgi:hypothetical protein
MERMKATTSLALLLCVSLGACAKPRSDPAATDHPSAEAEKEAFGKLTIEQLEARMNDAKAGKGKLAIFDNNQQEQYAKGHIPTARWVDFKNVKASDLPSDKDTPLVFYCSNEH